MTPNKPSQKNAYMSRNKLQNRLTEETNTTIAVATTEPAEELTEPSFDDVIKLVVESKIEVNKPTTEEKLAFKKAPKSFSEMGNLDSFFAVLK